MFADWKYAYLVNKLTPGGTITLDRNLWISSGRLYLVNDNQEEWINFTSNTLTGSYYILGWVTRDIDPIAIPMTSMSTGKTWLANQKAVLVQAHDQMFDPANGGVIYWNVSFSGDVTYTKTVKDPVYANASARDLAIPSPSNGMSVYLTAEGYFTDYQGGAWNIRSTGTAVWNATTTVAWKVEIATQSEFDSRTDIGWTGAYLVPLLSYIPKTYTRKVALWENISSSITNTFAIPTLTSDSWNVNYIVSASSVLWIGSEAYKAFDASDLTNWRPVWLNPWSSWVKVVMPTWRIFTWFTILTSTTWPSYTIQWSNDWSSWTTLYTWWTTPTIKTTYIFSNTTAYTQYRINFPSTSGYPQLETLQFSENVSNIPVAISVISEPIYFENTLNSWSSWSRIKSWIWFNPVVTDVLGTVITWQTVTSTNARVQLLDSTWNLITEKSKTADETVYTETNTTVNGTVTRTYSWSSKIVNRVVFSQTWMNVSSFSIYANNGWPDILLFSQNSPWSGGTYNFTNYKKYSTYKFITTVSQYTGTQSITASFINPWDVFDFTETVTKDTQYYIVVNDSAYFNSQNNELDLISYKTNCPYCTSGYLNWNTSVPPQAIKSIYFWTKKWIKAIANNTAEYAALAGFISWPKSIWDYITLDANDGSVITWFDWLMSNNKYYISDVWWLISTSPWTITRIVWLAMTSSSLYLSSQYYPWTTITKP